MSKVEGLIMDPLYLVTRKGDITRILSSCNKSWSKGKVECLTLPWLRLVREKVVVTLVQVTRAGGGGASLSSSQQPLLQGLGDKLIGKNALKDAGKVVMITVCVCSAGDTHMLATSLSPSSMLMVSS